ncbi:MAG: membrane protein insertase YidC, partial [Acidobacteria bacterium]|nr:membrane protein insertase YidC [Acidobacteriota bacterium]
ISNGETTTMNSPKKKDLPMELRLLLAFILMGVVLFTTPYFYKSIVPPPAKKAPVASQVNAPAKAANPAAAPAAPVAAAQAPAPPVAAQKAETFTVRTDVYEIAFSNRGGVVTSWKLKKYDYNGKPLELVNSASNTSAPFSLYFPRQKPPVDLNTVLYAAKPASDGLGIDFEYSDGHVVAQKSFRFSRSGYVAQVSDTVTENGSPVPNLIEWRGGFGDTSALNAAGNTQALYYDARDGKLVKTAAKAAKDGPVTTAGDYTYAGVEDQPGSIESVTFSDSVATPTDQKAVPFVGTAVGGAGNNHFSVFVGPKKIDLLKNINPQLAQLVDYGWFTFLAKPLFYGLHWTYNTVVHNWGWSIVLVTIAINFIIFPLKVSSMKSMKKMQSLQPQIAAINDKYKGISMRDPRKAEQNAEVMELYKKNGVNPMGGCVPMLLQIPFFFAFYKVISVSIEMRGANWLWVSDLSRPEALPIHILPIAMIVSQFIVQKMTPNTSMDPNQQRMMMIMPLVFGFMFYGLSSGLVLYYLTSNLVGIAQQLFFNRTVTVADVAQPVPVRNKKNGRK